METQLDYLDARLFIDTRNMSTRLRSDIEDFIIYKATEEGKSIMEQKAIISNRLTLLSKYISGTLPDFEDLSKENQTLLLEYFQKVQIEASLWDKKATSI